MTFTCPPTVPLCNAGQDQGQEESQLVPGPGPSASCLLHPWPWGGILGMEPAPCPRPSEAGTGSSCWEVCWVYVGCGLKWTPTVWVVRVACLKQPAPLLVPQTCPERSSGDHFLLTVDNTPHPFTSPLQMETRGKTHVPAPWASWAFREKRFMFILTNKTPVMSLLALCSMWIVQVRRQLLTAHRKVSWAWALQIFSVCLSEYPYLNIIIHLSLIYRALVPTF